MFCKYCGIELSDNVKYCPNCGEKIEKEEVIEIKKVEVKKQSKCWYTFCKVSKILGFVSFVPFVGLETSIIGIVFAILGKHCDKEDGQDMRKTGLTCSIVGLILSIIYIILLEILIVFLAWLLTIEWE